MTRVVQKRFYALKAVTLIVAIAVGQFLEAHPTHVSVGVETPEPLTGQG